MVGISCWDEMQMRGPASQRIGKLAIRGPARGTRAMIAQEASLRMKDKVFGRRVCSVEAGQDASGCFDSASLRSASLRMTPSPHSRWRQKHIAATRGVGFWVLMEGDERDGGLPLAG